MDSLLQPALRLTLCFFSLCTPAPGTQQEDDKCRLATNEPMQEAGKHDPAPSKKTNLRRERPGEGSGETGGQAGWSVRLTLGKGATEITLVVLQC